MSFSIILEFNYVGKGDVEVALLFGSTARGRNLYWGWLGDFIAGRWELRSKPRRA